MFDPAAGASAPLAPAFHASSVYRLADLDALDRIMNEGAGGYIYARDDHPNGRQLGEELARLEHGNWGIVCGSGMAAISAACLACVSAGDRILASQQLYGRTLALLKHQLTRFRISVELIDCFDPEAVQRSLGDGARLLIVETLSNPLLRAANIPALAEIAHRQNCRLLVDNTFASPALFRPLEHGADIVMESLTKMIGGHSDLTLGSLCGNDADLKSRIEHIRSVWGFSPGAFDCWLALRGMATFELRMLASTRNASQLASWLSDQKEIDRVIHPDLPSHPDRELAQRLLSLGRGNMLCFELNGGRDSVNRFMRQATDIPFCPSLGHTTTTCSHPASTSHRFESDEDKQQLGISDGLIRLSVGVEPIDKLRAEIERGLR